MFFRFFSDSPRYVGACPWSVRCGAGGSGPRKRGVDAWFVERGRVAQGGVHAGLIGVCRGDAVLHLLLVPGGKDSEKGSRY